MKKTNHDYEAIRELICLGFYANKNLNSCESFLGRYKVDEKEYDVYFAGYGDASIFMKCGKESIFLMVEDKQYTEYLNGPLLTDVILRVNRYKNLDINHFDAYDIEKISTSNIVNESKILLYNYLYSSSLCYNPNEISQPRYELEEKRYLFCEPKSFDELLTKKNFLSKMDGVFEPKIIINIISQIYSNFKPIYINNKINGIIETLNQEELILLKDKLQEHFGHDLTKKLTLTKQG